MNRRRTDRCPYCNQPIDTGAPCIDVLGDGRAHLFCAARDVRAAARRRAWRAIGEGAAALVFVAGAVHYFSSGGIFCLAGAVVLAWDYPERHALWLRELRTRLYRFWKNVW